MNDETPASSDLEKQANPTDNIAAIRYRGAFIDFSPDL
jgi:hypothetical protein